VTGNLGAAEISAAKEYALAEAARPIFGQLGFTLISIAALVSTASAINATLYGGANVSYMIAEKGYLPGQFRRRLWQIARGGLIYTTGLVIVVAIALPVEEIAMAGSLAFLLIYGAVNLAHLRLRDQTKARSWPIWIGLAGCFAGLVILATYVARESPHILMIFAGLIVMSFFIERFFTSQKDQNDRPRMESRS
jgi:amino acid transporter